MGKLKNAIYRFMYGRYGSDTLNKVLLGVYLAIVIVYSVVSMFITNQSLAYTLWLCYSIINIALVFWIVFRMFSRNIQKRRKENERFCGFFKLRRNKFRDRKTHIYRKCPQCKAVLRLPRAKGKHAVVCPRCHRRFEVKG